MLEAKWPELIAERMKNFNISFSQAVQEIKEMFPQYSKALDKLILMRNKGVKEE